MKYPLLVILAFLATGCSLFNDRPSESYEFDQWILSGGEYKWSFEDRVTQRTINGSDFSISRYEFKDKSFFAIYSGHNPRWDSEAVTIARWKTVIGGRRIKWNVTAANGRANAQALAPRGDGLYWHLMVGASSVSRVKEIVDNIAATKQTEQVAASDR